MTGPTRDAPTGVLLMAYGTPESLEQVEPYFTHIRGGKPPSPAALAHLVERYRRVGGRTPLLEITRAVRDALEVELNRGDGAPYRVYVGMKHWHPFIADTVREMTAQGIRRLIAMALAPHYSRMSIGGYRKAINDGRPDGDGALDVTLIESWHRQPEFVELIAGLVRSALSCFPPEERSRVVTVFTAHSLPERIRQWDDPYERELRESGAAVAARVGLHDWRIAWQSASDTGEPWLGPDMLECLQSLKTEGVRNVLQVPIGFVSDHLEILYDIDIEAKQKASALGMILHRTALPNAMPAFIETLAAVVRGAREKAPVTAVEVV